MQFNAIRTFTEMVAISGEWNSLLVKSASHVPFLRNEYLSTWFESLGGGEWDSGELFIVTARKDDGSLAGIAPMFFTQNRDGRPALMLLGSIEISDYLDVIAPPEHLETFIDRLLDFIVEPGAPKWQALDWYNIPGTSPTLPALEKAASRRGCRYIQEPLQNSPCIPLPKDWETYLAGIDKKQRHEIRRKLRRAASHQAPVDWYMVKDGNSLDEETEALFTLMAMDPDKERFLTQKMRAQMRSIIRSAFEHGWLQLAFATVGGERAAAYLNFDYENRIWVYNSGFNPDYRELSLGWVLLSYLIQWSIEQGREAFDFMRGDELYKYRFGGVDRQIVRAMIARYPET